MCDPVSIGITLATSALKSMMQSNAAADVRRSQEQAMLTDIQTRNEAQRRFNADLDRQRQASQQEMQNSLQTVSPEQDTQRREEATQTRVANMPQGADARTLLPGQGDASAAVRSAVVNAQNQAAAGISDENQRRALLEAFGDSDLGRNIQLLQNANRIRTNNDFARGAGAILQADRDASATQYGANMQRAQSAGDRKLMAADAIDAIGSIGGAVYSNYAGSPTTDLANGDTVRWSTNRFGIPVNQVWGS